MDTLFTIRHNSVGLTIRIVFFTIFFLFASFLLYQLILGPFRLFPMQILWIFILVAGIFMLLGLGMLIRTLLMIIRPRYITAGKRTIQYKKETYDVDKISRFVYKTHYDRNRDGRYLKEELIIEGEDGALTMKIDSKNMSTKELLNLFRTHYPDIELVVLNARHKMDGGWFGL